MFPCMAHTLRDWVSESGMTHAQAARAIGRNISTLTELLSGRRWPDSTTVAKCFTASGGRVNLWDAAFHMTVRQPRRPRGTPRPPPAPGQD
jgi:Helix-turn-helix domain